jgi:8-oxo-dGTP pyrophosphatase MutT (NUDIX family)
MDNNNARQIARLAWKEQSRSEVFRSKVFSVRDTVSRSPEGVDGHYTIMDCPDWAIIVPVLKTEKGDCFVMVRQWRHGSNAISLEFPGGVIEKGENPDDGARRELGEETAYSAGTFFKLGAMGPNPAIQSNTLNIYCASDLQKLPGQKLDADEFVDVEIVPLADAKKGMGKPPFIHALTAAGLGLYLAQGAPD